jgi:hypothetical protein
MTSRSRLVRAPRGAPCALAGPAALLVVLLAITPAPPAAADPDPAVPDTLTGAVATPAAPVAATPAGGIRADRLQHASLALAIGVGVGLAGRAPAAGAGAALTLAVAKELLDDRFDRGDLAAGIAGAALAGLVVAALTR